MPTKSPAQKRLMQAAAHTKGGFGGVPQKVGKEFVSADKRLSKGNTVKKVKKMADGGLSSLGNMIPSGPSGPPDTLSTPTSAQGGNSAASGLDTIGTGTRTVGEALSRAESALGGGGGSAQPMPYKKGGHVTTRRVSTGSTSKKSPCW